MADCDKFMTILAAGEEASAVEREAARGHAATCRECRLLAEAFEGVEEALGEVAPAPRGFASRVMARLPLGRKTRAAGPPSRRVNWRPAWIASGAAALFAAVLGGVAARIATTDPEWLSETSEAFEAAATSDPSFFGTVVGATVACLAVAGYLAYYYLVPAE